MNRCQTAGHRGTDGAGLVEWHSWRGKVWSGTDQCSRASCAEWNPWACCKHVEDQKSLCARHPQCSKGTASSCAERVSPPPSHHTVMPGHVTPCLRHKSNWYLTKLHCCPIHHQLFDTFAECAE